MEPFIEDREAVVGIWMHILRKHMQDRRYWHQSLDSSPGNTCWVTYAVRGKNLLLIPRLTAVTCSKICAELLLERPWTSSRTRTASRIVLVCDANDIGSARDAGWMHSSPGVCESKPRAAENEEGPGSWPRSLGRTM